MRTNASIEARLRAASFAHHRMIQALWVTTLSRFDEPLAEAAAHKEVMLSEVEEFLTGVGTAADELDKALAIDELEWAWNNVIAELHALAAPTDLELAPRDERTEAERRRAAYREPRHGGEPE